MRHLKIGHEGRQEQNGTKIILLYPHIHPRRPILLRNWAVAATIMENLRICEQLPLKWADDETLCGVTEAGIIYFTQVYVPLSNTQIISSFSKQIQK